MRQNSFCHTLTNSHVLLSILILFISMVNVESSPLILRLRHELKIFLKINRVMGPAHSPSLSLSLLYRVSSLSSRESGEIWSIELSSNHSVGYPRFHRENQRNKSRLNRVHSVGFIRFRREIQWILDWI